MNEGESVIGLRSDPSRNPFLEKEEEYKRINAELEQKSTDLFDRIEKFSKSRALRLRQNRDSNLKKSQSLHGGGDDSLPFSDDDFDTLSTWSGFDCQSEHSDDLTDKPSNLTQLRQKIALLSNNNNGSAQNGGHKAQKQPGRLQRATESIIQSLQSKLVNHEERLAHLTLEYRQKIQENTVLEGKLRAMDVERQKMFKTISTLQATVEKHAKSASSSKTNLNIKESTVGILKKEIEQLKRTERHHQSNSQSLEARLHRVTEENERLKNQNKSQGQQFRESNGELRQKLDAQSNRIQELERQKAALNSALIKQGQLVNKLKKRAGLIKQGESSGLSPDPEDSISSFSP